MQVATCCADPGLDASVVAVLTAGAMSGHRCDGVADLVRVWGTVTAVVLDVDAARQIVEAPLPSGPAVFVVCDDMVGSADAWRLAAAVRAAAVVALPGGQPLLLDALLGCLGGAGGAGSAAHPLTVGVVGSGAGAGASTLAVLLAAAAARAGRRPVLIDGDPTAGGLDLLLGAEAEAGARWGDVLASAAPSAVATQRTEVAGIGLLSWGRSAAEPPSSRQIGEVIAALGDASDVVVTDAGRHDAGRWLIGCRHVIVVCSRQVRGAASAAVLGQSVKTERMALVTTGIGPAELSPAEVSEAVGLPLLGELPYDVAVARRAAAGRLHHLPRRGRVARAADRILRSLDAETAA